MIYFGDYPFADAIDFSRNPNMVVPPNIALCSISKLFLNDFIYYKIFMI